MAAPLAAVLVAAAPSPPPGAPAPAGWDRAFYDPAPQALPDDVVLPLPCGGAMAFRPVATPAESKDALADRAVRLGRGEESTGYVEYLRNDHLLGALSRKDGSWYFLLGKFEVTTDQWNAVMGGACAAPSPDGLRPKGEVSWFEAVEYGRKLTEWILKERRTALPVQGEEVSFLRLPTEAEWEFAARGGIAVSDTQFLQDRFFPEDQTTRYVVFREPGREAAARPVGNRQPNPLGLYDMLGNVEEWVLDPFRANREGRPHGQAGGFVARGGSFRTDKARIRSSLRLEYPAFDARTGAAWRSAATGFRLAVAAPVLASSARTEAMKEAWQHPSESGEESAPGGDVAKQLHDLEAKMTDLRAKLQASNTQLGTDAQQVKAERDRRGEVEAQLLDSKTRIEAMAQQVRSERDKRNESEGRFIKTSLLNGAILVRGLIQDVAILRVARPQVEFARSQLASAQAENDAAKAARYQPVLHTAQETVTKAEERVSQTTRVYTDAIVQLAHDCQLEQQSAQKQLLEAELAASQLDSIKPFLDRFDRALTAYRRKPGSSADDLVRWVTADRP